MCSALCLTCLHTARPQIGDDPLEDGIVHLARLARMHLLRPLGVFSPCRIRIRAVLASVRTTTVSGFDLRSFNIFRCSEGARCAYDLEHLQISEPGVAMVLSMPTTLLELDLNHPDTISSTGHRSEVLLSATRSGIVNCVCWYTLDVYCSLISTALLSLNLAPSSAPSMLQQAESPTTSKAGENSPTTNCAGGRSSYFPLAAQRRVLSLLISGRRACALPVPLERVVSHEHGTRCGGQTHADPTCHTFSLTSGSRCGQHAEGT